ncbi:MAG: hypothetical protein DI629_02500 [Mesorhizobium amorphae]|nr:MAG: hypothetical protein DI629_02500 [Mesorhizobium amorphae]
MIHPLAALLPTAAALAAVLVARRGVSPRAAGSALVRRLRALYTLTALLLGLRLAGKGLEHGFFSVVEMMVAAWLPLAGLRLVEEMLRRHAPRPLKLLVLGGGLAFSLVALLLGALWSEAALLLLAGFQALATAGMIVLLLSARPCLSPGERQTADTFLLALLLTIPLAASDFQGLLPDLPLRGGAFAVLILVLATSRLARGDGAPLWLLADLALCLGGGAVAAAIAATILPTAASPDLWLAAAGGFLVAALALLVERFALIRLETTRLVRALARADGGRDGLLRAHPLLASAEIVDERLLDTYPTDAVRALAAARVVGENWGEGEARNAARDLLDATGATHLLRLSENPPRFLAVSAGGLAGPSLHDELTVAAMLIESRP